MFKKDENESLKSFFTDLIKTHLLGRIKQHLDEFIDSIQETIVVTQRKFIRSMTAAALFIVGLVFIVVGAAYFFIDVLKFTRSSVFLIGGIVLVLISIILAQSAKLLKYDFKK